MSHALSIVELSSQPVALKLESRVAGRLRCGGAFHGGFKLGIQDAIRLLLCHHAFPVACTPRESCRGQKLHWRRQQQ